MTKRNRNTPRNPDRERKTTVKGAEGLMKAAHTPTPEPPKYMPRLLKKQRPYWDAIMNTRSADLWTDTDIELAHTLACAKADLADLYRQVRREGYAIETEMANGTRKTVVNPAATALDQLEKRVVSMTRMLHISTSATQGRPENTGEHSRKVREFKR